MVKARMGRRAAYRFEPRTESTGSHRSCDRPFERVHIDHTQNGQLGRRTALINFPRYDRASGFRGFLVALKGFQDRLPFSCPPDLLSHADYMYETSLGLVGVMKNHIERALALALASGNETITFDHLEASVRHSGVCSGDD